MYRTIEAATPTLLMDEMDATLKSGSEMVEEMRDLIEYSASDAVTLQLDLAAGPQPVHVDRGQLENALLNYGALV